MNTKAKSRKDSLISERNSLYSALRHTRISSPKKREDMLDRIDEIDAELKKHYGITLE